MLLAFAIRLLITERRNRGRSIHVYKDSGVRVILEWQRYEAVYVKMRFWGTGYLADKLNLELFHLDSSLLKLALTIPVILN
jgi:hypothetical protein